MSNDLVARIGRALHELAMLNETPVHGESFEATGKISGGKPESAMPQKLETELDHFSQRLRKLCWSITKVPVGDDLMAGAQRAVLELGYLSGRDADYHGHRLVRWCQDAEDRVREQRKGQADEKGQLPALKGPQKAYWLLESMQGVEYRTAAKALDLEPTTVADIRKRHGQTAEYGRPRTRAPKKAAA